MSMIINLMEIVLDNVYLTPLIKFKANESSSSIILSVIECN